MSNKNLFCFQNGAGTFLGRLLVGVLFLIAAWGLAFDFRGGLDALSQVGIKANIIYVIAAIMIQLIGGILLVLGLFTRFACCILVLFLILITFVFHSFWIVEGYQQALQFSLFLKNFSLLGALVFIASSGPGPWSLDAWKNKPRIQP